jgi:hypothetical protein
MPPTAVQRLPPLYNDRGYPWSLDRRNAERIRSKFLVPVKKGIMAAAKKFRTLIDPADLEWLHRHNGDFQMFCHPEATHFKEFRKRKERRDKTIEQLEVLLEMKQKVILGKSPRFATQKPNTAWNYESFLRQLWWFLAIIGDYASMLILLPHPCTDYTPSCSAESLRSFIIHRFATRGTPLLSSLEKPVQDIHKQPILAEGTIQNYVWIQSAYAGITSLHVNREQTCSYVPACKK